MYILTQGRQGLGDLGWFVKTLASPEGHEVLTREAAKGLSLTSAELTWLIEGVRRPDTASLKAHVKPGEQRRHVLRSTFTQSSAAALADAIGHLRSLHARVLGERDPAEGFRLIGEALHLIQDSYAPAHVDRSGGTGPIRYVRNYGPTNLLPGVATSVPVKLARQVFGLTKEHGFPADRRDHIYTLLGRLKATATAAIQASREYLQLVLRQVRQRLEATAAQRELAAFVSRYLTM